MFTNLIFLIIALVITGLEPYSQAFPFDPWTSFFLGLGLYLLFLGCIGKLTAYFKRNSKKMWRDRMLKVINTLALSFLVVFYLFLGAQRVFVESPFPLFFSSLTGLFFYLGALWTFHYAAFDTMRFLVPVTRTASTYAWQQVQFLAPFALPFLVFNFLLDLLPYLPGFENWVNFETPQKIFIYLLMGTIGFILIIMIFLPYFIQKIWQCEKLEDEELANRLEKICQKANFKHAGIKTWTVMGDSLTAAIIGIVPRFRYIMFTKRILREMSPETIEAILAHEIGHSKHKHLVIYPFILLGMVLCLSLFSFYIEPHLSYPLSILGTIFVVVIYFRLVFGFFSRLFERQADLHVFQLNLPPQHMIDALNYIGVATGHSHSIPNWHHFSIQERMNFLQQAMQTPGLISQHHFKVKFFVTLYLILLFSLFGYFLWTTLI